MVRYVMLILLVPACTLLMFWQANDIRKSYKNAERIKKEAKSINEDEINELIMKLHKDYRLFLIFAFLMLVLSIVIICIGPNAFIS